jgi:hypothetical protein
MAMLPKPAYSFLDVAGIFTVCCAIGMVPFAVIVSFLIDRKTMKVIVPIAAGMATVLAFLGLTFLWFSGS